MTSTQWQKSSYSGGGDDNHCLEIAATDGGILLRESDEPQLIISMCRKKLKTLIDRIKSGEMDHFCA